MDEKRAQKIILNAVVMTRPTWSQYKKWSWKEIDRVFIQHGYEQQGFQNSKMIPLLKKRGIFSIHSLGAILLKNENAGKYDRKYAGSQRSKFFKKLRKGEFGKEGELFADSSDTFLKKKIGNPGRSFWKLLWQILHACAYLRRDYKSSFAKYIFRKYEAFSNRKNISRSNFLKLTVPEWDNFVKKTKPWRELKGIGWDTFDFIFRDIKEVNFAKNAYKFDSANQHFLKVTGISQLIIPFNKAKTIEFLKELRMNYALAEIKGRDTGSDLIIEFMKETKMITA